MKMSGMESLKLTPQKKELILKLILKPPTTINMSCKFDQNEAV